MMIGRVKLLKKQKQKYIECILEVAPQTECLDMQTLAANFNEVSQSKREDLNQFYHSDLLQKVMWNHGKSKKTNFDEHKSLTSSFATGLGLGDNAMVSFFPVYFLV